MKRGRRSQKVDTVCSLVLDANNLIVRNIKQSQLDDLRNGEKWTGGVYGSLVSIAKILRRHVIAGPVYACFDAGSPPARLKLVPEYKSGREKSKSELTDEQRDRCYQQIEDVRTFLPTLGVKTLKYRQREADDTVAAVTRVLKRWRIGPIVVVSNDKDLLQLVDETVSVWNSTHSVLVTPANFEEVVGTPKSTYLLYKTLVGDPSDSLAGAPGCGDGRVSELLKTHAELLADQETCYDQLVALAAEIGNAAVRAKGKTPKFKVGIAENVDRLTREMQAVDLSNSFGGTTKLADNMTKVPPVQMEPLMELITEFGFASFVNRRESTIQPFQEAERRRDAMMRAVYRRMAG